jgi:CubicO group peptidase (beta-lactamase class C family)
VNAARRIRLATASRALFIAVVVALLATACSPQPDSTGPQACHAANVGLTGLKDQQHLGSMPPVDALMATFLEESRVPGAALGIVVGNEIVYLKGYGHADVATSRPFTIATPSPVGSISKTITALAVLRLVELGYLGLDDHVGLHVPATPSHWQGITIRQLLANTSWLQRDPSWNYPSTEEELKENFVGHDHPGFHPRYAVWGYTSSEQIPTADRPPGLDGIYSNVGYSLLGAVVDTIAHVHGLPEGGGNLVADVGYEPFVFMHVGLRGGSLTEPTMTTLCLNAHWREDAILDLARGYRLLEDGSTLEPHMYALQPQTGWEGPAGGWTMTIGDLTRLMLGLQTNQFLSAASMQSMMQQHGTIDAGPYGLGVFKLSKLGRPVFMHGGNIDGYTARFTMWHNAQVGVALMVNRATLSNENLLEGLANDIAALFLD